MSPFRAGCRRSLAAALLFAALPAYGADNMDARIDEALRPFADAVSGFIFAAVPVAGVDIPFVLVWLIFAATLFTVYFGFINLRAFRHGF